MGLVGGKNTATAQIDWVLLLSTAALMMFGVAFVYSASAYFAEVRLGDSESLVLNHVVRVVAGLVVVFVFSRINYRLWQRTSIVGITIAICLLIYVIINGQTLNQATRWISIGPIGFQPSEFAKFALIVYLSTLLAARQHVLSSFREGVVPLLTWTGVLCVLIAVQPDFSTAAVIFGIAILLLYIGNVKFLHLIAIIGPALAIAAGYAMSAEYRMRRLTEFWSEEGSYQVKQGIIAFGNGGIFGVGPGRSLQRDWFLPESYTDFIFSIIGEEYGFLGAGFILFLFGVILWRGLRIARNAPDLFGRFLAAGITIVITVYAIVNAGVTCGLIPTTGLPMPFVSYGGTSILFTAAALGILLNISAQTGMFKAKQPQSPQPMNVVQ